MINVEGHEHTYQIYGLEPSGERDKWAIYALDCQERKNLYLDICLLGTLKEVKEKK